MNILVESKLKLENFEVKVGTKILVTFKDTSVTSYEVQSISDSSMTCITLDTHEKEEVYYDFITNIELIEDTTLLPISLEDTVDLKKDLAILGIEASKENLESVKAYIRSTILSNLREHVLYEVDYHMKEWIDKIHNA